MAIVTSSTDYYTQNIFFVAPYVYGLDDKTIDAVIDYTGSDGVFALSSYYAVAPSTNEAYDFLIASGKVRFAQYFSGGTPNSSYWDSVPSLSAGVNRISVTYNKTSAANDPIIYINGSSVSITTGFRNTGSAVAGSGNPMTVCMNAFTTGQKVLSVCIYNRILSAAEIADAYNSRLAIPNYKGLVFAPNLIGAAGLQTFDGATLGSTNYLKDMVSGATGTPNGSPVGAADTRLNWK